MRRRCAALAWVVLGAVVCGTASAAHADRQKLPCVSCSVIPAAGLVGAWHSGVPDPAGPVTYVMRDLGMNPIAYCNVQIDFSACGDVQLCDPGIPGQFVYCSERVVSGFADATGTVRLVLVGAGINTGAMAGAGENCARVYADGVPLGTFTFAIADQNGAVTAPGVEITDLTALLRDFGTGIYYGRSDFDHDGQVTVADLSRWLGIFGGGMSSEGCAASACP
jgi:hypothetical protein